MKKLMHQYKMTAKILYKKILKFKNLNKTNNEIYNILVSEYQQVCLIHKQITNYCKARGIL